jgi:hypothetical protein
MRSEPESFRRSTTKCEEDEKEEETRCRLDAEMMV